MNNLTGAARRVTRNLDQFSVICVFGSVVGCVLLPLMVQSMESFIITFLVLFLTAARPLKGRLFPSGNQAQENDRRRSRERDENKKPKKSSTRKKPVQVVGSSEQLQRIRVEDLQRQEQQKLEERERRLEEKREKKARKKEERLQRKEEEKKEKEREDQLRKEKKEARLLKKKEEKERKQKTASFDIPTHETIQSIVNATKPLKRERKHSTSSSASSISAHSTSCQPPRFQNHGNRHSAGGGTTSQRHSAPFRASSDPEISLMTRTSPAPVSKSWQPIPHTLPSTHGSSHWYTDIANRTFPNLPVMTTSAAASSVPATTTIRGGGSQPLLFPQAANFYGVFPAAGTSLQQTTPTGAAAAQNGSNTCWSVPPTMCIRGGHLTQVGEPLQHFVPQTAWLPVSGAQQQLMTTAVGGSNARNFSPAPGTGIGATSAAAGGMSQQFSRFLVGGGGGYSSGTHSLPHGATMYDERFLLGTGFGPIARSSTGVVVPGHHGNSSDSCYSLFSSGGGSQAAPFSPAGGLLNLDTSSDHMRHQAVSTGSPLSVNSDLSDGLSSLESLDLQRSQSDMAATSSGQQNEQLVENISSTHSAGGSQSYDEWPNI